MLRFLPFLTAIALLVMCGFGFEALPWLALPGSDRVL